MNWDAIGAISEIIGAIAVIWTLVYLARQISQSVDVARASQNRTLMESYEGYNDLILANPIVADLLANLEDKQTDATRADKVRIRHLGYRMMNIWASAELAYTNGQLGHDEFALYKNDVRNVLDQYPGMLPYVLDNLEKYPAMKRFEIYSILYERGALS